MAWQYLIGATTFLISMVVIRRYWTPCIEPTFGEGVGFMIMMLGAIIFFSEQILWVFNAVLMWGMSNAATLTKSEDP